MYHFVNTLFSPGVDNCLCGAQSRMERAAPSASALLDTSLQFHQCGSGWPPYGKRTGLVLPLRSLIKMCLYSGKGFMFSGGWRGSPGLGAIVEFFPIGMWGSFLWNCLKISRL